MQDKMAMAPTLSIVTTLYRSEAFVDTFVERAVHAAEDLGESFEIIFVDDGSPDNSSDAVLAHAETDERIHLIQLSRNFGHHAAAYCAIEQARGDYVFLIDSDLETDPATLKDFWSKLHETDADVVFGVQETRAGRPATRILGGAFWRMFNRLSDTKVPDNVMTERLMRRSYVEALLTLGDRNLFMAGMFYWPGFHQEALPLVKSPRTNQSSYSFKNRVILLVRAVSSFSSLPLLIVFWCGAAVLAVTAAFSVFLVVRKLLNPESVLSGFTALALLSTTSFGINFMALGILGLYVHRIFRQVQNRPRYIIRNTSKESRE